MSICEAPSSKGGTSSVKNASDRWKGFIFSDCWRCNEMRWNLPTWNWFELCFHASYIAASVSISQGFGETLNEHNCKTNNPKHRKPCWTDITLFYSEQAHPISFQSKFIDCHICSSVEIIDIHRYFRYFGQRTCRCIPHRTRKSWHNGIVTNYDGEDVNEVRSKLLYMFV